jgi:hypothetical protein
MKINTEQLNNISLDELSSLIIEDEFRNYFLGKPGEEHYTLLAHFSTLFNNATLLDVGTYKGCSALALSYNDKNQVVSFDVREGLKRLYSLPSNVKFMLEDITDDKFNDLILSSPFILLDTDHDGPFEHKFYNHLKSLSYKGILMLDDIYLNEPMKTFWDNITEEKIDLSHIGHHSGTGLVIFN